MSNLAERFKEHTRGLNWPAFFFSSMFVVYGLVNISDVIIIKVIAGLLGLYIDYEAQYIWGLSHAYKDAGKKWAGRGLKAVYLWYFVVFALMSGVGAAVTEITIQENVSQKLAIIEANNQHRVNQLNRDIERVSKQMEQEGDTGAGPKYIMLKNEKEGYEKELKELIQLSKTEIKVKTKAHTKDMFANLSKALWNIPKYTLILIMFGSALVIVYIGLMLKPMRVELESQLDNVTPNLRLVTRDETDVTRNNLGNEKSMVFALQNGEKYCPSCELAFRPVRSNQIYCCEECRVQAFRGKEK